MTTPLDFMAELRRRGVVLTIVDDRLRVRAPRGQLSTDDRDILRAERDRIAALVREEMNRPAGLLPILGHAHACGCGRRFKCTAPSCAGKRIPCVLCRLDGRG